MLRRTLPILAATVLVACGAGATPSDGASDVPAAPTASPSSAPPTASPNSAPPAEGTPATIATSTDVTGDPTGDATSGAVVPAALQFSAPLVGGGEIELGALAGRPVLLWFWAPW